MCGRFPGSQWGQGRLRRWHSVTFLRKMYAVPWQHCCSGELYDWQTSDHRIGADAISFAGLRRSGSAALAKFLTGEQQRAKLGWWTEFRWRTELGWCAALGRSGSTGARARASFRWIPLRRSAAGSSTAFAAGSPAAPSAVRQRPGPALGITSNGTASSGTARNGAGSAASHAEDGRLCDRSRTW